MTVDELRKELEDYPDYYEVLVEIGKNGFQHKIQPGDIRRAKNRIQLADRAAATIINPQ